MPSYDALRLLFEREGGEIRLLDSIPVEMVVPEGDDPQDGRELTGYHVCLYDGDGGLVYRRGLANPLFDHAEVYTGDPERPFVRVPTGDAKVTFDVVVPDTRDDAAEVELLAPPADADDEGRRISRPVARFPVRGRGVSGAGATS